MLPRFSPSPAGAWPARRHRCAERAPRYFATAALALLVVLGLRTLLGTPSQPPLPRPGSVADMPSQDFALQFARAYLTYDAVHPGRRALALAPFLPEGLESDAGSYQPRGSQRVDWADVASDQPALAGGRVITIAAAVSSQRLPLYLAVTIRHDPGQPIQLLGYPAFVGAPASQRASLSAREPVSDPAVATVAERVVRNYLASSAPNLKADLTPDAQVTLPTVVLRVRSIERLEWTAGPGSAVLATVSAAGPRGATYTLTYELGIAYRERPYVDFIEVIPTES